MLNFRVSSYIVNCSLEEFTSSPSSNPHRRDRLNCLAYMFWWRPWPSSCQISSWLTLSTVQKRIFFVCSTQYWSRWIPELQERYYLDLHGFSRYKSTSICVTNPVCDCLGLYPHVYWIYRFIAWIWCGLWSVGSGVVMKTWRLGLFFLSWVHLFHFF